MLEQPTSSAERPEKPLVLQSWQNGFWSLVVTQFQGAFNDNAFKNLVVFLILGTGLAKADRDRLVLVAGALFSVPFILFSMTGGFLADRFSKRTVTIGTKFFEIAVMLLAAAGLAWQNLHLEMAAIFLASTQAAFFGPSKYGLLPELLPEPKLSWGNGVIELGTFLAAIAGLVSGAFLADVFHGRQGWSGLIFIDLSLVGLLFSLGITKVPAADRASHTQIDAWAKRHNIARGDVQSVQRVYDLGAAWYGHHLDEDWHKWTMAEAKEIFRKFELCGPIWDLPEGAERF